MDSTQTAPEFQSTDLELLKKMEDEHLRLQRQVRMIQTDRMQRTMGVHPQFRRQDKLLKTLKKEYINVIKDLKIAKSGAHKKNDKKMKNDLMKALLLRMKTVQDCDGGITLMEELDGLLQRNKEMLFLKKVVNANKGLQEERRSLSESRLVSTENKLEAAMLRFNVIQSENKKIRDEIEHMLKDRAIFNQAWNKMLTALNKGKKFLSDLFESSTLAYDQRDEWCTKLKSVQEKGKMDQMLQVQEMRELKKAFDHEMTLYNFLAKKGVIRMNKKQEQREEEQKRKLEEDNKREFDAHIKLLDEINDFTQEPSYSKIIDTFMTVEQENFSVYKLLTDYCAENEVLSRDLKRIRQDIEDRRDWNEMMESKREEKLENLKRKLEEVKSRTTNSKSNREEQDQLLNGTMEKIGDIFKMLDCSVEPFQNLLGDKQPSLHRMNLSLRLITDKIQEHIQTVYYYEHVIKRTDKTSSSSRLKKYTVHAEPPAYFTPYPISVLVPADTCPNCVEARWVSRVADGVEAPLDKQGVLAALAVLAADPAYVRSDRVHTLAECRVPASRVILARRTSKISYKLAKCPIAKIEHCSVASARKS